MLDFLWQTSKHSSSQWLEIPSVQTWVRPCLPVTTDDATGYAARFLPSTCWTRLHSCRGMALEGRQSNPRSAPSSLRIGAERPFRSPEGIRNAGGRDRVASEPRRRRMSRSLSRSASPVKRRQDGVPTVPSSMHPNVRPAPFYQALAGSLLLLRETFLTQPCLPQQQRT